MRKEYEFDKARRGAVIASPGKTRITIYLDDAVIESFRVRAEALGRGYRTLINEALRAATAPDKAPVSEETLRRVLREELQPA